MTHDNIIGTQNRQIFVMLTKPCLGRTAQRFNGMLKSVGMQNSKVTITCVKGLIASNDAKLFYETSHMPCNDLGSEANRQQTILSTWNDACLPSQA